MTKEQLFKRWFEWSTEIVIKKECLALRISNKKPEIEFIFTEEFCKAKNVIPLVNFSGFLRIYIKSYYSDILAFVYAIPKKYHKEWEEYVREKNND